MTSRENNLCQTSWLRLNEMFSKKCSRHSYVCIHSLEVCSEHLIQFIFVPKCVAVACLPTSNVKLHCYLASIPDASIPLRAKPGNLNKDESRRAGQLIVSRPPGICKAIKILPRNILSSFPTVLRRQVFDTPSFWKKKSIYRP